MPNVMADQPNIGGAFCWMLPQSLPTAGVPCSKRCQQNARLGRKVNSAPGTIRAPKIYIHCSSLADGQTSCKVWLTSVERCRCSNEAKTRNPLKFAGMPQTRQQISAASGPKFTILWGHVGETLLLNKFFSDCRYMPSLGRYSPINLCDVAQMANFGDFCILYFQQAACTTFQTCILNWRANFQNSLSPFLDRRHFFVTSTLD